MNKWICKKCSPVECLINSKDKPPICLVKKEGIPNWQLVKPKKAREK